MTLRSENQHNNLFSNVNKNEIVNDYINGFKIYEIMDRHNCSPALIKKILKAKNINKNDIVNHNDNLIIENFRKTNSVKFTSINLNLSERHIYKILQRNNISIRKIKKEATTLTKDYVMEYLRYHNIIPRYKDMIDEHSIEIYNQIKNGDFTIYYDFLKNTETPYRCDCGETDINNFYTGNKKTCKKCISIKNKEKYLNYDDEIYSHIIDNNRKNFNNKFIYNKVVAAKHRAKILKLDFDIDVEFIKSLLKEQDGKCFISKVPLQLKTKSWNSLSIDRKDSTKGYTKDNVIIITKFLNIAKSDLDYNFFIDILLKSTNSINS